MVYNVERIDKVYYKKGDVVPNWITPNAKCTFGMDVCVNHKDRTIRPTNIMQKKDVCLIVNEIIDNWCLTYGFINIPEGIENISVRV